MAEITCPKCGGSDFKTARHKNARIDCASPGCGFVIRDEGASIYNKVDTKPDVKIEIKNNELVFKRDVIYMNPQDVKIEWFTNNGQLLTEGDIECPQSWMWRCIAPGIDHESVVNVKFPELNYESLGDYKVEITVNVYDHDKTNVKTRNTFEHLH